MNIPVARKWIKSNLSRLQNRFRLEDWEITVEVKKYLDKDDPNILARCHPKSDYQSALIEVGTDSIPNLKYLEMVMSHELLHCVLSPLDNIRDTIDGSDNEAAKIIFYKFYYSTVERVVRSLELILGLGIKGSGIV